MKIVRTPETAIDRAVLHVGGAANLAELTGVTRQAVDRWVHRGRCPPLQAIPVEKATGGRIRRSQLRPDLYPPRERSEAPQATQPAGA